MAFPSVQNMAEPAVCQIKGHDVFTDVGMIASLLSAGRYSIRGHALDIFHPGVNCCTFSVFVSVSGAVSVPASMSFIASCKAHSQVVSSLFAFSIAK